MSFLRRPVVLFGTRDMDAKGAGAVCAAIRACRELAAYREGDANGRVWVAFSGGMDSTVLLHALREWPRVAAVHVDHGLAEQSADWARHCREVARGFGVEFRAAQASVEGSGNLEARLRRARYAALGSVLGDGDVLALAHHADDQAETRLWQFLTGRHPGGMPTARALGAGQLVRPLLQVRRESIANYAKCHGLRWVEDPSNADHSLDRNFIRHRLMPLVEEGFPTAFARLAAPRATTSMPGPLPATADHQEIRNWLEGAGMPLSKRTVAEIHRQGPAAPDRNPVVRVAPGVCAWRYQQVWRLVRQRTAMPPSAAETTSPDTLTLATGELSWQPASHGLAARRNLTVRVRSGGEALRTKAGTRTLKALFQQDRIPPWLRPTWPLLYDGNELVAVPNLALADSELIPNGWTPIWTPANREITAVGDR